MGQRKAAHIHQSPIGPGDSVTSFLHFLFLIHNQLYSRGILVPKPPQPCSQAIDHLIYPDHPSTQVFFPISRKLTPCTCQISLSFNHLEYTVANALHHLLLFETRETGCFPFFQVIQSSSGILPITHTFRSHFSVKDSAPLL